MPRKNFVVYQARVASAGSVEIDLSKSKGATGTASTDKKTKPTTDTNGAYASVGGDTIRPTSRNNWVHVVSRLVDSSGVGAYASKIGHLHRCVFTPAGTVSPEATVAAADNTHGVVTIYNDSVEGGWGKYEVAVLAVPSLLSN